jgi:hypothetical protein
MLDHPITLGGVLLALGFVAGLFAMAFGALMVFAAGMSDAGDDGTGGKGCAVFIVGLAILISCIVGIL